MKKILFFLMCVGSTSFAIADCVNGNFPAVKNGVPNATSRCTYHINADFLYGNGYGTFIQNLRNDYRANHNDRDFVVINDSTNEAYHLNQGDLYLDGITEVDNNVIQPFISIDGQNDYGYLLGKNNPVNKNSIQNALFQKFIVQNNVNNNQLKSYLLPIITAIPEATKFNMVGKGILTDSVTNSWSQSYEPIVKNWAAALEFNHMERGTPLTLQETLGYLQTQQNQNDCRVVLNNVAGPISNIWAGYCGI
jgi:hypothetical protein